MEDDFETEITEITSEDTGDKTIYAKWKATVTCNITYELDGGTNNPNNLPIYTEGIGLKLFDPIKENFIFKGWYLEDDFQTKITEISSTDTGDKTIYAKWETAITYNITYELDGGTNHPKNTSTYTKGIEFMLYNPSKDNHTFEGWYLENDFQTKITQITSTDTGDKILYAKWKAIITYNITYELDGGTNHQDNPSTYTEGVGTQLFDPSKNNNTFKGWYLEDDFQTKITEISSTDTGDKTIYAKWEAAVVHNITYELNGGTNHPDNPSTYTEGVGTQLSDPSKDGYTFEGWYLESGFQTEVTEISSTDTADKTLYAKWEVNVYNITYELDGGTNHEDNSPTYTYGIGLALADPTKAEHTFEGWYSEADFQNKITGISTTDMGDKTVYAKFTRERNVEEPTAFSNIKVYPTAFSESLTLQNVESMQITICDLQGRVIYSEDNVLETEIIQTSTWTSGIYFVNLKAGQNKITKKVIKVNNN